MTVRRKGQVPEVVVQRWIELYRNGATLDDVARTTGWNRSTVHRTLVTRGVPRRPTGRVPRETSTQGGKQ